MKIHAAVLKEIGAPALYAQILPLQVQEVNLDPPSRSKAKFEITDSGLRRPYIEEISARWRRNVQPSGPGSPRGETIRDSPTFTRIVQTLQVRQVAVTRQVRLLGAFPPLAQYLSQRLHFQAS